MKYLIFPACFFVLAIRLFAADYYVDSKSGNDTNDGKTAQSAWKSLDAVNKANILPGDTVRFKRGGQWRGRLKPKSGEEGRPVLYTAYGDAAEKPGLLGSVPLDKESDWSREDDRLWATRRDTVRTESEVPGFSRLSWSVHREGGAKVGFRSAAGDRHPPLQTGTKEYTLSCEAPGSRSNHIQLIVHGFKVEAGKHYMLRLRARSSRTLTIPSIGFSEPGAPWGGLGVVVRRPGEIGPDWEQYDILFRCDTSHEKARFTLSMGGAMAEGTEFSFVPVSLHEATVESNGIHTDVGNIILDGSRAGFKKWTLKDLENEDDFWYDMETNRVYYRSSVNPALRFKSIEAALHRHVVDHSNCGYVIFDGLDIRYGAAHGFGGTKTRHCVYRNLDISWIGGADQYREGGAGRRVRFGNGIEFWSDASDCLVERCRIREIYDAALTNQGSGVNVERNITYRGNTIWNSEYSFEYWNRGPESVTDDILFENNVCVNAGCGWGHVQRPDKNGRHVMIYSNTAKTTRFVIRNNVFHNARNSAVRIDADFRDGLTMEGNVYWQPPGRELFFWLKQDRFTTEQLAEYQRAVGLDKSSKLEKIDLDRYPDLPKDVR